MTRLAAMGLSLTIAGAALVGAPAATAAPSDTVVVLTSAQLADAGFPKKPNTVAWQPGGTASLPTTTAAQWQDIVITGKAPTVTVPGQILTLSRFLPSDTQGSGVQKPLNITAVVQKDRSFTLHFQLGMTGTWGYAVGYSTGGASPEFVGFQFQFTTTGSGAPAPSAGSSSAVTLSAGTLARAGFTKAPNVVGWGGTATISTSRAKAGAPVTISGTAPASVTPGSVLSLERFVPTDRKGSGHFEPVSGVSTVVKADGTFELTFEVNQRGRYGYTLGVAQNEEWIGIEFQLKTT